jgi:hypothetical protein
LKPSENDKIVEQHVVYSRGRMEKKGSGKPVYCKSVWEVVIGGVSSWIIGKALDFVWRKSKSKNSARNFTLQRFGYVLLCFAGLLLDLHPAEVKFSVWLNRERFGVFKGPFKSLAELYCFALCRP